MKPAKYVVKATTDPEDKLRVNVEYRFQADEPERAQLLVGIWAHAIYSSIKVIDNGNATAKEKDKMLRLMEREARQMAAKFMDDSDTNGK